MGKVLKIGATVIGVASIVFPGIGSAISGAIFRGLGLAVGTTGTAAAAALTLGKFASAALSVYGATGASPVADMEPVSTGIAKSVVFRRDAVETIMPIRPWWHFRRWAGTEIFGDCMAPHVPHGWHCLIDRWATIRAGDLIAIRTSKDKVAKRFVELEGDHLVVATSNPRQEYRIPLAKVKSAYRVRAMGTGRNKLVEAVCNIRRDANAHMERLASIIIRDGRQLV